MNTVDLNPTQRRVYSEILGHDWYGRGCWPSQERLARLVGVCVRTIKRAIAELVRLGYIAKRRVRFRRTNFYTVVKVVSRGKNVPYVSPDPPLIPICLEDPYGTPEKTPRREARKRPWFFSSTTPTTTEQKPSDVSLMRTKEGTLVLYARWVRYGDVPNARITPEELFANSVHCLKHGRNPVAMLKGRLRAGGANWDCRWAEEVARKTDSVPPPKPVAVRNDFETLKKAKDLAVKIGTDWRSMLYRWGWSDSRIKSAMCNRHR